MDKTPNNKFQITNKHQAINSKRKTTYEFLEFGNLDLFVFCYLRFRISKR